MISTTIKTSGPIFDGRANHALDDFLEESMREVGDESVNVVQARLGSVLKNPTGYYESRIVTDISTDDVSVNDSGVVYGPWLEGVGSRNQTTRFKGYATFRRVTGEMQDVAPEIAENLLQSKYLGRMQ